MKDISLKLPTIPSNITPELHQYYASLHQNIKYLESGINELLDDIRILHNTIKE